MSTADELRKERERKRDLLIERGIDPYPATTARTHRITDVLNDADAYITSEERIVLTGRVMSIRRHGGSAFADIFDGSGKVQVFLSRDVLGEASFDLFNDAIDPGDFIETSGTLFRTKRDVEALEVSSWTVVTKALRAIPSEFYGIKDEDERYRKRYLDMLLNPDAADIARKRSVFWNSIRKFMLERGFIEVETPILETTTGGAEARPFVTHHHALDIDVFLRISVGELWQKKLLVAGIEKTFEIGRIFRNEGMSHEHAQDYTSFEFYEAYQDAREGVPMLIELYRTIAQETFGTQRFSINGFDVDLGGEWASYDFNILIRDAYGFDPREVSLEEVRSVCDREGIAYEPTADLARCVDLLWKQIRKTIGGPAILTGMPVYLEPLAKKSKDDTRVVERFQILIGGSELGKAFNELNDPADQRERFRAQQALRDAGDEEAQMADMEFVEALEYGMPPAFGFGVSERLFSFLLGTSIREAQLFPLMRPKD